MFNLGSRKAIAAGALAAALFVAGCASQSQANPSQLGLSVGPNGMLLQQPAPAQGFTTEALPAGEFGGKVITTGAESTTRFSANLDATESAVKAQQGVAVKAGCGMP